MYIAYLLTYVYELYEYECSLSEIPDPNLLHNALEEYTGDIFNEEDNGQQTPVEMSSRDQ